MQAEQFQLHAQIEESHWWFVARRQIMRRLVERLVPPSLEKTVVDVGCGTGGNIAALADAYRCVGIDTSAEAIDLAQQRFPQVQFHCGFAPGGLGQDMGRANIVLMMDVLEHVENDVDLLTSVVDAATPGTYFLLTVPADMSLWSQHDESFGHFRRYDLASFRDLWAGLPVKTRLVSHYNSRLYPAIKLIRSLSQLRGRAAGASGTDFHLPNPLTNTCLKRVFEGESRALLNSLDDGRPAYQQGVSLMAVLSKEPY
jgi:SAM-dependent methyltransferase